jgi:hypothetical protein
MPSQPLRPLPLSDVWLAPITGSEAVRAEDFAGDPLTMGWLHSGLIATAWSQYVKTTDVTDSSPPPAPSNLRLNGDELSWDCIADLESGIAGFLIERNGAIVGSTLEQAKNPFGRPLFQSLQYSDTPPQPLATMTWRDPAPTPGMPTAYRVIAVNTRGLRSDGQKIDR